MATLNDLRKSIREMTDEELAKSLQEVRSNRRAPRDPSKPKKAKAKSGSNPVAGISKAEAARILQMIEERSHGTQSGEEGTDSSGEQS